MVNMTGIFFLTLVCTLPTWYQRQKLAAIQNSHIALLAEMKHAVSMLNAHQTDTELEEVADLLSLTAEKLEASDIKPMVFGMEVEAWSMGSTFASAFAIFSYWMWWDSGINPGTVTGD
tara:strand:- start:117 stop:470 length:354 start_codon:yes stop_codon:yes gene_type:complete